MDKFEIGNELKRIRIARKISQEMVADYLGSTVQRVSSFETGRTRIDLESFISLCAFYGISADAFFHVPAGESALSPSEQALVDNYRALDPEGRAALSKYAEFLASSSSGSNDDSQDQVG